MAWRRNGSGSVVTVTSGNITLTETGSNAAPGNLIVATIAARGNAAFTLPADWNLVDAQNSGNTTVNTTGSIASGVMAWIIRGASAPSYAFTRTGGDVAMGCIHAYENPAAAPFDVVSATTMAVAGTTISTPALTTAEDNELVILMVAQARAAVTSALAGTDPAPPPVSDPTGNTVDSTWRERVDTTTASGADCGLTVTDVNKPTAGSTGLLSGTTTLSARHVLIAGSFKLWSETADEVQASRLSAYAVMSPPSDKVSVSRASAYAIMGPPQDRLAISKLSAYTILKPRPTERRRHANRIVGADLSPTDPHWDSVVFMLDCYGPQDGTQFRDRSNSRHTITRTNNAVVDHVVQKFPGHATLKLDGTDDDVRVAAHADFHLADQPFTIDSWVYITDSVIAGGIVVGVWSTVFVTRSWVMRVDNSDLFFSWRTSGESDQDLQPNVNPISSLNTWYHVRAERDASNNLRLFVNGVMRGKTNIGSVSFKDCSATRALQLGQDADFANDLAGRIYGTRITKGVARHGSDASFTTPDRPYPLRGS